MKTAYLSHRKSLQRAIGALLGVVLLSTMVIPLASSAATASGDQALLINQSNRYAVLPPGRSATIWFDFKNTGTTTWTNADPHPVSLNTDGPMKRTSMFQYKFWRASWRPSRITQAKVKPGETARVRFSIKAPNKPGTWIERFSLVRDTDTKISGGDVEFVIVVGSTAQVSSIYRAQPVQQSLSLWVQPGQHILKPVTFRNVGYASFQPNGFGQTSVTSTPMTGATSTTSFDLQAVAPIINKARRAQTTSAVLDIVAPTNPGTYSRTFGLYGAAGHVAGSDLSMTLIVSNQPQPPMAAEPTVRVGVFAPVLTKPVDLTANGAYEIRTADSNTLLFSKNAGEVSSLSYNTTTKVYSVATGTTKTTTQAVRFVPLGTDTIMEIKTMSGSYNRFRETLEAHYSSATGKLWIINELPMETYLDGLGETGSTSPAEFVKTLLTAARTYALYKVLDGKKHDNEYYKINSTTDQVYKGYNYEVKTPNITAGVAATRGMVIAHPSMITAGNIVGAIVAAYSSCTDGRTRSYYERWGGAPDDFPYLISVPDPLGLCTTGGYPADYMTGGSGNHMVGMSAYGALKMSQQPGASYDAVLRYYYSGTSVLRAYL